MRTTAITITTILSAAGTSLAQCPFTSIGSTGFRFDSSIAAISADGNVAAGRALTTDDELEQALRWTPIATRNLGDLPGGASQSSAFDLSADGSVIVGRSSGLLDQRAFRWENNVITALDDDPTIIASTAYSVTADGLDAVGRAVTDSGIEGVIWSGGGVTRLPDLGGGPVDCVAFGISPNGDVIVGYATDGTGTMPVRWTSGAAAPPQPLGALPGGSGEGVAYAASDDGGVIVGGAIGASGTEAFRWSAGVMTGLGDLPGGAVYSVALDCTADGSVVVGVSASDDGLEAFIWDEINGMQSVKTLAVDTFGLGVTNPLGINLSGWTLTEATGISADGRRVVGTGLNIFDQQTGWLLDLNGGDGLFCPCDLDCDFNISALDTLLYLGRWFPREPSADYDDDGIVDVLDLLDFLNCFFVGRNGESCPD